MALQHPRHYHLLQRVRQCEGKSTIPTINPFCDTSNDAIGNGGEAECRGQKRTKHFSQSCVASLLPVCSANLDTESYRCKRRFIIFMERRRRLASFCSMPWQQEVASGWKQARLLRPNELATCAVKEKANTAIRWNEDPGKNVITMKHILNRHKTRLRFKMTIHY